MEPIVSSETSAIRTQTPGNYPKRNKVHLEHGESLKTRAQYCSKHVEEHNKCIKIKNLCIRLVEKYYHCDKNVVTE